MKLELLFAAATLSVLPWWLLMIGLPQWRVTQRLLRSTVVLLPLPVLYGVLVVWNFPLLARLLDNPTLPGVALVLGEPEGALLGWLHFLALDFFVGRWIYLDSLERQLPGLAVVPVLWATLLLGPLGLLLYVVLRSFTLPAEQSAESPPLQPAALPLPTEKSPGPQAPAARRPRA